MNTKTLDRGTQRYEAPSLEIIELAAEGVLCASGDKMYGSGLDDLTEDTFEW